MRPPFHQQVTFLDTRDLPRTIDFYERILGLRLARDQGRCRIYHVTGGAYLGFCERGGGPENTERPPRDAGSTTARETVVLTLITDQVDEWFAHVAAQGAPVVKPPADNPPYRIYNAFVRDPNGYLVEIQRFWEPLG